MLVRAEAPRHDHGRASRTQNKGVNGTRSGVLERAQAPKDWAASMSSDACAGSPYARTRARPRRTRTAAASLGQREAGSQEREASAGSDGRQREARLRSRSGHGRR